MLQGAELRQNVREGVIMGNRSLVLQSLTTHNYFCFKKAQVVLRRGYFLLLNLSPDSTFWQAKPNMNLIEILLASKKQLEDKSPQI